MSFVLSWSGYFSRKGWDPVLWAKANKIKSYEQCHKRISKMCIQPPSREEYLEKFVRAKLAAPPLAATDPSDVMVVPPSIEVFVKQVRPEAQLQTEQPKILVPTVTKEKVKRAPSKSAKKKTPKVSEAAAGSGTDSIISSVKKKTSTKNKRSRKNAKSS